MAKCTTCGWNMGECEGQYHLKGINRVLCHLAADFAIQRQQLDVLRCKPACKPDFLIFTFILETTIS